MKRRIIALLTVLGLAFSSATVLPEGMVSLGSNIVASAATYGDYKYTVLDDETVEISKYNGEDTDVIIPSTIGGKKITRIGDSAFYTNVNLKSVIIPDGVKSIGYTAFNGCTNLSSVKLPDSVTSIDTAAFSWCTSLTDIIIPIGVTSIGDYAFYRCSQLTSIELPSGLKRIGTDTFSLCSHLTSITIPKSVTSIGEHAFSDTQWLKNKQEKNPLVIVNDILIDGQTCKGIISIPKSVKIIGNQAFYFCIGITSISIPNSVKCIGEYAFYNCESLKSVNIPGSVKTIGGYAFAGCQSLENVKLLNGVELIGDYAFAYTNLKSITIPGSVKKIGTRAFDYCTSLEKVKIQYGVKSIGEYAFVYCTNLYSITVPDSVTSIGLAALGYFPEEGSPRKVPFFKIICIKGSKADKYAQDNGFKVSYKKTVALANVKVKNQVYTGKAIKPAVTVKFGKKSLKKGTDYTVTYKNNKSIGTATVTATGKGNYTGSVSKTFKINPKKTTLKSVTSPKTKQLKATYNKVSGVTGYQVTYSTSKKFTKATTKSVNASGTSKTISKLTKGKTYYVKVRTYKTVNGTKYYSGYSEVKKVKIK